MVVASAYAGLYPGMLATALFGGLASSTAVTVALARRAKTSPEIAGPAAGAALLASAVVGPRLALLIYVVAEPLLARLVWPLLGLVIGSALASFLLWRGRAAKDGRSQDHIDALFERYRSEIENRASDIYDSGVERPVVTASDLAS